MADSEGRDAFIGVSAGLLVGLSASALSQISFFGLGRFMADLISLAMSIPYGNVIRLLFLAVTLLFILGAVIRFRDDGIAIVYSFLLGLFITFL